MNLFSYTPIEILGAYANGYFPTLNNSGDFFLFRPESRPILQPSQMHISKTLRRNIEQEKFEVTFDQNFKKILEGCTRAEDNWISKELKIVYSKLYKLGFAHSVECLSGGELVGGLYGLAMGGGFFVESMFSQASDASKVALAKLCEELQRQEFSFVDFQLQSQHLKSLGAVEVPNSLFQRTLQRSLEIQTAWGQSLGRVRELCDLEIRTESLKMRSLSADDAPQIIRLEASMSSERLTLQPRISSPEMFSASLAQSEKAYNLGVPDGLAIEHNNQIVGLAWGFYPNRFHPVMEVAIQIYPYFRERGFARQALQGLMDNLWESFPIHKIRARVVPQNTASNRLMESLGMVKEGCLRKSFQYEGAIFDLNMFAVYREHMNSCRDLSKRYLPLHRGSRLEAFPPE